MLFKRISHLLHLMLGPLVVFVAFLLLWQTLVTVREIPRLILPSPWQILLSGQQDASRLAAATGRTITGAAGGLAISIVAGFVFASILSQSSLIRRSFLPYAIVFQTMPIIGVAPLLITWFGNTLTSVVLIAAFISVFPVISNTTAGMISADRGHVDLFRLNGGTRWQTFWKLQVPSSLPFAAAGIRIAAAASVLGACVGDFFVGSAEQEGLGFLIFQSKDQNTSLMFATLAILTLVGIAFFGTASLLSRWFFLGWEEQALGN